MARTYTISIIKPAHRSSAPLKPTDGTFNDLFVLGFYMPTYFAYRLADDSLEEYSKFVSRIKESLQEVLVPFAPYAGRWVTSVKNLFLIQLIDNGEGVPLIETYIDKDIDEVVHASGGDGVAPELNEIGFKAAGFDPSKLQQEMRAEGHPTLVLQITRFKKGGVVLGVTFNHVQCDANGFFQFMMSWSEVARTGKSTIQPDFNRSTVPTFEAFLRAEYGDNLPQDGFLGKLLRLESAIVPGEPFVTRTYEVKASAIEGLKKEAKASPSGQYVSTNDCVTAFFSKILAQLSSSITEGKETLVPFVIEGRDKFYDTPQSAVVGNVMTTVVATMPPNAEVAKKSLSSLAQIVRESLLQLDEKNLFTPEKWMGVVAGFSDESGVLGWLHSSWTGYPVFDIDFGVGGRPYFHMPFNSYLGRRALGLSFVLPPIPGHIFSAATVYINSVPKVLEELEALEDFWSFFVEVPR